MPLNSTTYLESHGWEGKGVPLDGKQGRGLKKPLALPMKRNQRGLGKDRDRATEWWDSLFEASAKTLNIKVAAAGGTGGDKLTNGIILPTASSSSNAIKVLLDDDKKAKPTPQYSKVSLVSQAKRDYARKMLMSGFVRGREVKKSAAEEELEAKLKEEEIRRRLDKLAAVSEAAVDEAKEEKEGKIDDAQPEREKSDMKAKRNEEKRKRKMEKEARKEEKAIKKSQKEEKKNLKNVLREEKERKKEKKEEKAKRKRVQETPADSPEARKSKKKRKREEA